jgi:hypothetical protein
MRSPLRPLALPLAFASWLVSAVFLLVGLLFGRTLRCDDGCRGSGWRGSSDAWQWDGIVALGLVAFLAGTVFVVLVRRRLARAAAVAFLLGLASALALAEALAPDWHRHVGRAGSGTVLFFLGALIAPIAAIVVCAVESKRTTDI